MSITVILLVLLGAIGVLVAAIFGVVGYLALKLFKKELNLKITIESPKSKNKPS